MDCKKNRVTRISRTKNPSNMEVNMEIIINLANNVHKLIFNESVTYEVIDDEGFFFVETTNKIVIMNSSAYFLWTLLKKYAEEYEYSVIEEQEIIEEFSRNFKFDETQLLELNDDIDMAIIHFIQEEFFYEVA